MKYALTFLLAAVVALSGCRQKSDAVTVSGKIHGLKSDTILYIYGISPEYDRVDTIPVNDSLFSFTLDVDTVVLAELRVNDTLACPLFLSRGEKLDVEISPKTFKVTGNELNESLNAIVSALENSDSLAVMPREKRIEEFIAANPNSPACIYLLLRYVVRVSEPDAKAIEKTIASLSGPLQDDILVSSLTKGIQDLGQGEKGKFAPLFRVKNEKGEMINRLSDFSDKCLLITFWASWDKNSLDANKQLRALNKRLGKKKDFAMLGISFDVDAKKWRSALERDSLSWEQACETSAFNSEIARQFNVKSLPCNVLISSSGRILERGLPLDSIEHCIDSELEKMSKEKEKNKSKR